MIKLILPTFSALAFATLANAQPVAIPDICKSIVDSGMKNSFTMSKVSDLSTSQRSAMCSETTANSNSSSSDSVDLWFKKTGGSASNGTASNSQFRKWFCGEEVSEVSEFNWQKTVASFYDSSIVNALEKCIEKASSNGLTGVAVTEGNGNYTVSVSSTNILSMTVNKPLIRNFNCEGSLANFTDINSKKLTNGESEDMLCYRVSADPEICPDGSERYPVAALVLTVNGVALPIANLPKTKCFAQKPRSHGWKVSEAATLDLSTTNSCTVDTTLKSICDKDSEGMKVNIWAANRYAALGGDGGLNGVAGNQGYSASISGSELTWGGRTGSGCTIENQRSTNVTQYQCELDYFELPVVTKYLGKVDGNARWSSGN